MKKIEYFSDRLMGENFRWHFIWKFDQFRRQGWMYQLEWDFWDLRYNFYG